MSDIALKVITPPRPTFFDPKNLPWTQWVMEGTYFKLLNIDTKTGGFTMLLKVDPDNDAPIHHHIGAVEAYVLEGEFGYEDDRGGVGTYTYEEAGSRHQPTSPGGTVMFAVVHAPLMGYNEDGSIAAVVDGVMMMGMAKENGAADHLSHITYLSDN